MKIERAIVSYDKSTEYGDHVKDYPIAVDLVILKEIFQPYENDPLLYDCYEIDQSKSELIKKAY